MKPDLDTKAGPLRSKARMALGELDAARAGMVQARAWLMARANKVLDPKLRLSFLQCVPDNAEILELASALGVRGQ
ncbi:MAG TPA: hypothetical protein PK156_45935 [Polyangium sp.]|nr:hypothetical protein [Polyangium sp.]